MAGTSSSIHTDGKFDFNVSSGAILNLFSRDYHYLHFPGADQVNQEHEQAKQEMSSLCAAFKPPKNTAHYKEFRDEGARQETVMFGDVLVSEDGGFKWRLYTFSLQADQLRIKRPRVPVLSFHIPLRLALAIACIPYCNNFPDEISSILCRLPLRVVKNIDLA